MPNYNFTDYLLIAKGKINFFYNTEIWQSPLEASKQLTPPIVKQPDSICLLWWYNMKYTVFLPKMFNLNQIKPLILTSRIQVIYGIEKKVK